MRACYLRKAASDGDGALRHLAEGYLDDITISKMAVYRDGSWHTVVFLVIMQCAGQLTTQKANLPIEMMKKITDEQF